MLCLNELRKVDVRGPSAGEGTGVVSDPSLRLAAPSMVTTEDVLLQILHFVQNDNVILFRMTM